MGNHPGSSYPPAIFLMGPTASGKTDLAMALCQHVPCDIVSVDSAMIYRGMDIGTAKPTPEELARAPHRLIDICDPSERYSAADFRRDALREMAQITESGRIPLLVGGTMMYFKALLHGMSGLPSADPELRTLVKAGAWYSLSVPLETAFGRGCDPLRGSGGRYGCNSDLGVDPAHGLTLKYQPKSKTLGVHVYVSHVDSHEGALDHLGW